MKFKMSDRSLFAILLRSPWWVSLLIVLVFSLAARALLPPDYALMGALGTFPFVVIAGISAWRQWQSPSQTRIDALLTSAATMSWREFSAALEAGLRRQGYQFTHHAGSAADYILERRGQVILLSCRRWKAANHGVDALRVLQTACQAAGADQGLYASLAQVSEPARQFAEVAGIRLVHGQELAQWLM